ncbi:MAG: xanthine dehydrogenase family protein subunit M [Gammaproteobacteria bacterium]|nr:xanthine dehydrogenase family protein subunit M [Gammaproteobacteria bacterium]
MKTFANHNPGSVEEAVAIARAATRDGSSVSFAAGGTDLLQLVKDRIPNRPGAGAPDVLVNLKSIPGIAGVAVNAQGGLTIGGLVPLSALSASSVIRERYSVLAEAAEQVASPQIRNTGTLAGNVCQRPWCWYFRNGFDCYKAGGNQCFSIAGENQLHAIFGGGPSFIVHPSDVAPALVALDATFHVVGPDGERMLPAADFFVLPRDDVGHENVLGDDEVLVSVNLPAAAAGTLSSYHKVMDRETWTHAVASAAVVLDMENGVCRSARIVLGGVAPIPWRVQAGEALLVGERVTAELADAVGVAAVAEAQPLAKNAYKVPLTRRLVERTVLAVSGAA